MNRLLPFSEHQAETLLTEFGSPLYVYDEAAILQTAQDMQEAFSWAKNYKNYFAVKATPTPAILASLHSAGMGLDCSSRTELLMAQRLGIAGEDIFFTSNNTTEEDFKLAIELDATVNIDDEAQVPVFLGTLACQKLTRAAARYNPGNLKKGNEIIGNPVEAKYGMDLESLVRSFKLLAEEDIAELGLHTMVASNELNEEYFEETAELLFDAIETIEKETNVEISFVNLGGGFGVNYRPEQAPFDLQKAAELIRVAYQERGKDISLFTENGRYVTGPHGYLLTRVRYVMHKYKDYLGVDASMHNLMRPGMYGAYHHLTILGKEGSEDTHTYDVVGSLCENNDKFAIDRLLPEVEVGDIAVIHDAGAHGHAMGFNYNGLLRSAEVLLDPSGEPHLIRRTETVEDYFAPLIWD